MTHVTREPARVYIEHLMCECGGEMVMTERSPPAFGSIYACQKCGAVDAETKCAYPGYVFEPALTTMAAATESAIKAQDVALGKREHEWIVTQRQWETKGRELFGNDTAAWMFVCPSCGAVGGPFKETKP